MAWGWLLQVGRILGGLLSRPEKVREAVREANEFLDAVDSALHDDPPPQPLPHSAVEEQRRQIDAATSHKVAPADAPPVVVDTRGPGVAKAKERTKKPPRTPPRPPRKGG